MRRTTHRLLVLAAFTITGVGGALVATAPAGAATNATITVTPSTPALSTAYTATGSGCAAPAVPTATMNNVQARDVFASLVNQATPTLNPDGTWSAAMPGLATASFYFLQSTCFNATTVTNEIFYRSEVFPVGGTPSPLTVQTINSNTVKVLGSGCKTGPIEVRALGAGGAPGGDASGTIIDQGAWEATINLSTTPVHYYARCSGSLFEAAAGQAPPDTTVAPTDPATTATTAAPGAPSTTAAPRGLPSTGSGAAIAAIAFVLLTAGSAMAVRARRPA